MRSRDLKLVMPTLSIALTLAGCGGLSSGSSSSMNSDGSAQQDASNRGAGEDGASRSAVGNADAATAPSPASCMVLASSYDQSCAADTDCMPVYSGYVCAQCQCPQSAINVGAQGQFKADVEAALSAAGNIGGQSGLGCLCNPVQGCCQSGQCVVASACRGTADAAGGPANEGLDGGMDGGDASNLSAGSSGRADGGGRVPVNHRPNGDQCLGPAPAGNCMGAGGGMRGGSFMCVEDSDCTAGSNGRCGNPGGPAGCFCSYDTCAQDTDCPSGQTCACHGSPYNDFGNTCVAGNCRVDADCGAGGYCSPTAPAGGWCGDVAGYYCHTPNDLCLNDSDCAGMDAGSVAGAWVCEYLTTSSRWECQVVAYCI